MRRSITAKILITIAAVLIVTDLGLLGLGLSTVYRTVHKNYVAYAKSSAGVAADLLDGVDIQKLGTDESYAGYYRKILQELCWTNGLEYLYIYIPDTEQNTITFVMVLYGESSQSSAMTERVSGTVVEYVLSESERQAWSGGKAESVEETDNKYGHVLTAYSAVYDKYGNVIALAGADVSMNEAFQIFFERYRIMLGAVTVSFLFVLGTLAVILKISVLKPAKTISCRLKNFAADREAGFEKMEIKGSDEFAQMAGAFNYMAEEIDRYVKNINELTEEKHRQEAEISIAKNIQRGFLPEGHFQRQGIRLAAVMIPAKYVGGDFYDYFSLTENTVCTVIADVSGKGISAALFMVRAITVVRQYAKLGYSPSEILFHTNNALTANNPEQMFLTAFVGIYDSSAHKFTYANGGHNLPYLISDTVRVLDGAEGMTVGIFENEEYGEREIRVKDGDTVFMYTDGVNEAVGGKGEFFGIRRLEEILEKKNEEQCVETVLEAVKDFARDTQQSDDITMLAFSVSPDSQIRVEAELENLGAVQSLILENRLIPDRFKKKLCLAAEEIFVNICSYAYEKEKGSVEFSVEVSDKIQMRFCDSGKPFNPIENAVDIDGYDIETQIGGLGRWIAFDLADKADYEYRDNKNILTIVKYLKEEET